MKVAIVPKVSCEAVASKSVDSIHAAAVEGARLSSTLVDVGLAGEARPPSNAVASERVHSIHAAAVGGARLSCTFVDGSRLSRGGGGLFALPRGWIYYPASRSLDCTSIRITAGIDGSTEPPIRSACVSNSFVSSTLPVGGVRIVAHGVHMKACSGLAIPA